MGDSVNTSLPLAGGVGEGPVDRAASSFEAPFPNPVSGRSSSQPDLTDAGHRSPETCEREENLLRYRTDALHEEPAVPFAAFLDAHGDAAAVRLGPGDDARALVPYLGRLALVELGFPTFRDGRGYSAARILREAGYTGELRATGDVLVDQMPFMRRCGFDSFAPDAPIDQAVLAASSERYAYYYQAAADAAVPVWKRRHG